MDSISYNGATYVPADLPRGKKVDQVARMIQALQSNPSVPHEFEALCLSVGQKYPQDVQAAMIALELCEYVNRYNDSREVGQRAKVYYMWVGPDAPEPEDA
jgi:transposase